MTAVLAFNDRAAFGVLDGLERRGVSVPGDVSVTGFDNSLLARHARIDLTTVDQAADRQARLAVTAILAPLNVPDAPRTETVLAPTLAVRGSTGPAPRR